MSIRRPRRPALLLSAAAVALLALAALLLLSGGSGSPDTARQRLQLALPDSGIAASCAPFSVDLLRDMSPAFAGTVRSVGTDEVVLDVDRWYAGPGGEQVALQLPSANSSAALDGVDFRQGERYLVTAAAGTVNGCGYSGPATPELQSAFDEAFGG